jgi:hypothetical protein
MQARENQNLKVHTVRFPVAEKWKGTVNMATKEPPIRVGKDDTPQPFSKNFDQFCNSS